MSFLRVKGVGSDAGVLATWGAYSDERGRVWRFSEAVEGEEG